MRTIDVAAYTAILLVSMLIALYFSTPKHLEVDNGGQEIYSKN